MTVSDMLVPPPPPTAKGEGAGARARVRADDSVTDGDRRSVTWLVNAKDTVAADFRQAWLWDVHGPSLRSLWDARIPDRDRVPGQNRALWIAWCVYNHAALLALVPLMFAFWVASHPARLIYAAPVAAPLITLWLI